MAVAAPERPVRTQTPFAPKKIRIEVTEGDIRQGYPSGSGCPIALALRRAQVEFIFVTALGLISCPGQPRVLPEEAQTFISRFDQGLPVTPFAFDLA